MSGGRVRERLPGLPLVIVAELIAEAESAIKLR